MKLPTPDLMSKYATDLLLRTAGKPRNTFSRKIRQSFQNWISASERAKKLRRLGYKVSVPPPLLGRPQLIVISPAARKVRPMASSR